MNLLVYKIEIELLNVIKVLFLHAFVSINLSIANQGNPRKKIYSTCIQTYNVCYVMYQNHPDV